jgi:carbamoyltransferase
MKGALLGPAFTDDAIEQVLVSAGAIFEKLSEESVIKTTAKALVEGKAVGWMQGRMEFGPRALGSRSIIADPRSVDMQKRLNLKVKYRESFRPFAPSVLAEHVGDWFELKSDSPYMLFVSDIKKEKRLQVTDEDQLFGFDKQHVARSEIPAVTHVDSSARIQTVHKDINPLYHALITEFYDLTGCPLIVNTSFNIRGEPIVCSPGEAFKCFMGTELDVLAIGSYILYKDKQIKFSSNPEYKQTYELD